MYYLPLLFLLPPFTLFLISLYFFLFLISPSPLSHFFLHFSSHCFLFFVFFLPLILIHPSSISPSFTFFQYPSLSFSSPLTFFPMLPLTFLLFPLPLILFPLTFLFLFFPPSLFFWFSHLTSEKLKCSNLKSKIGSILVAL